MLIMTNPVPIGSEIAESLETHLSWMLLYLHRSSDNISKPGGGDNPPVSVNCEPPWVTVYLFKACLVAWQVMRMGTGLLSHTAAVIGVNGEDGLLVWMREVFRRREIWGMGAAALRGLRELDGR